jgi:hypothetical protein
MRFKLFSYGLLIEFDACEPLNYVKLHCLSDGWHFVWYVLSVRCDYPRTRDKFRQPDIDICRDCGEHAEFDENGSNCCGAGPYDSDPDTDMER